mmetsp:Transcript_15758/g.32884  ORF Transcript_15758/g.32884 Transcript_15758/m.32884 type:complete len:217 (-) Transcript_15758:49-699(-)
MARPKAQHAAPQPGHRVVHPRVRGRVGRGRCEGERRYAHEPRGDGPGPGPPTESNSASALVLVLLLPETRHGVRGVARSTSARPACALAAGPQRRTPCRARLARPIVVGRDHSVGLPSKAPPRWLLPSRHPCRGRCGVAQARRRLRCRARGTLVVREGVRVGFLELVAEAVEAVRSLTVAVVVVVAVHHAPSLAAMSWRTGEGSFLSARLAGDRPT